MNRVYNFAAGPSMLPIAVLQQAQQELLDWQGSGMSILEVSHRGQAFQALLDQALQDVRELLSIPEDYHILFLPGGGQMQFSAIPMNLLGDSASADYVMSGVWAKKAIEEARKYTQVNIVASNEASNPDSLVPSEAWRCDPQAGYLHYTPNETIAGLAYPDPPLLAHAQVPIIADMSSNILSKPIPVSKFGLIYGGIQKNIGPAGLGFVIIRDALLARRPMKHLPSPLDYRLQVQNKSCYNTAPVFQIYLAALMFAWLKARGGLAVMAAENALKAKLLYELIDASEFYINTRDKAYRSPMNVVFKLRAQQLEETFLAESRAAGLANLSGHRLVGGMRASLYNAMPLAGVEALVSFMTDFECRYG